MSAAPYPVPAATTRCELRFSNSRFIATLFRADSLAEAHAHLKSIRAEMPDATHHVYAFRAGFGANVQEAVSDDGEPAGTSGPPILAVLRGAEIGDAALVVTRYFGGTKLGTGGLVVAYRESAKAVLEITPREIKVLRVAARLDATYALYEPLRRLLLAGNCRVEGERFDAAVELKLAVPLDQWDAVATAVRNVSAGRCELVREPAARAES